LPWLVGRNSLKNYSINKKSYYNKAILDDFRPNESFRSISRFSFQVNAKGEILLVNQLLKTFEYLLYIILQFVSTSTVLLMNEVRINHVLI